MPEIARWPILGFCIMLTSCMAHNQQISTSPAYQTKTDKNNTTKASAAKKATPIKMKYGKRALKLKNKIHSASCKDLNDAFFDSGLAFVEVTEYVKKNGNRLSKQQKNDLGKEAGRYFALGKLIDAQSRQRCKA